MRAVDVHGFGGGFTLGAVQAGFELVAKFSRSLGFGVYNCLANRDLLGEKWESIATDPSGWYPIDDVQLVFGNPPCSGFSTLSPKHFRGQDSSINECMWEVVRYAASVTPEIVIFESVQQAFRQGLPLMRALREHLNGVTGRHYHLYHVLHNNLSVGGCSNRRRYFWVAARIPFGVDAPTLIDLPTLGDALRDLEPLTLTMVRQPYLGTRCNCPTATTISPECKCHNVDVVNSTPWARREMHDGTGTVDGHDIYYSPTLERIRDVFHVAEWPEGDTINGVMRRLYAETGGFPRGWDYLTKVTRDDGTIERIPKWQRLIENDFWMGRPGNQPIRWHGDQPARVVTGGGVHLIVHPTLPRTLTHREVARIQGFPDAWKIWPVRNAPDLGPGWGKGVPVQAGRWIADAALRALNASPGADAGRSLADADRLLARKYGDAEDESVIDITYHWRRFDTGDTTA